jgi:hypothetical protein
MIKDFLQIKKTENLYCEIKRERDIKIKIKSSCFFFILFRIYNITIYFFLLDAYNTTYKIIFFFPYFIFEKKNQFKIKKNQMFKTQKYYYSI